MNIRGAIWINFEVKLIKCHVVRFDLDNLFKK
jgi:hypothetical protein